MTNSISDNATRSWRSWRRTRRRRCRRRPRPSQGRSGTWGGSRRSSPTNRQRVFLFTKLYENYFDLIHFELQYKPVNVITYVWNKSNNIIRIELENVILKFITLIFVKFENNFNPWYFKLCMLKKFRTMSFLTFFNPILYNWLICLRFPIIGAFLLVLELVVKIYVIS